MLEDGVNSETHIKASTLWLLKMLGMEVWTLFLDKDKITFHVFSIGQGYLYFILLSGLAVLFLSDGRLD